MLKTESKFSFMFETLFVVLHDEVRNLGLFLTKRNSNFTQEQTESIYTYFISKYKCGKL